MRLSLLAAGLILTSCARTPPAPEPRTLVLISIDGFRWDYRSKAETPALDRLAGGVVAEHFVPPFPSYTFPSHYTIVTGLHPQRHGIVSNAFWDPVRKDQFKLGAPEDMSDGSWWGGEPIWNTAERQGKSAAILFWPGSEADIGGRRPTTWTPFDKSLPYETRVQRVMQWMTGPAADRPEFVALYFSAVDKAGHRHGPDSPQVVEAIQKVDRAIGNLLDAFQQAGLTDSTDVVVVSDHGMTSRSPERVVIIDEPELDLEGVHIAEYSPLLQAHTDSPAKAKALKEAIGSKDHVDCYLGSETPTNWNYREHRAIGDVVCLAENGWQLSQRAYFDANQDRFAGGSHGWDPSWDDMHGIFIASGPRFKRNVVLPELHATDVYGLLCAAIGIKPSDNDGDDSVLTTVLADSALPSR